MPQATATVPLKMPIIAEFDWCLKVYNARDYEKGVVQMA
jgi:hypothetical protein